MIGNLVVKVGKEETEFEKKNFAAHGSKTIQDSIMDD
jgi:hypothetical protein